MSISPSHPVGSRPAACRSRLSELVPPLPRHLALVLGLVFSAALSDLSPTPAALAAQAIDTQPVVVTYATPTDPSRTAALIAAMMLRFTQQDIKDLGADPASGTWYLILPYGPRVSDADLIDWLERAPKPLFAVPTYARGMIAAWPEVTSPQVGRDLANQQNGIAKFQETHLLDETAVIVLDTGTETVSFPLSHLKVWAANYLVQVGWNIRAPQDGGPARLMLTAPGFRRSPG